jgi:hypothetical protein
VAEASGSGKLFGGDAEAGKALSPHYGTAYGAREWRSGENRAGDFYTGVNIIRSNVVIFV